MRYPDCHSRTVLITGCSSGIGAAAAHHLRTAGWEVYPCARKPDDLKRLRNDGFKPISMDLANPQSIENGLREVLQQTRGALGALVNNAGFGQSGALEDLKREHLRYQFEVNVFGLQDLTNRCIPVFRAQGYGRIVHLSSVVGRISIPFLGAYSASKFAVEAFADAQRVELHGTGIAISLVEPGPIITEFRHTAARRAHETLNMEQAAHAALYRNEIQQRAERQKKPDWINKSPEDVAVLIQHALESSRPRRRYPITLPAYASEGLRRCAPAAFVDALFIRSLKRKNKRHSG